MAFQPSTLIPPNQAVPVRLLPEPPSNLPVGSPAWYVYLLSAELDLRYSLVVLYEDYFAGRHKLTFASSRFREAFGQMLGAIADNWIPLIVGATTERLRPQGFLFGKDKKGDTDAWDIWQRNQLDADAPLAFTEAAKHGESYLLVWPDTTSAPKGVFGRFFSRRSNELEPRITTEHPSQMVVMREAGDRRRRTAALKRWEEPDGRCLATLYLPDEIHYYEATEDGWKVRRDSGKNKLGVVPVVPLVNDPQMLPALPPTALSMNPHRVQPGASVGLGRSDMADAISTVDQINKLICDMMVASEVAAFRQRWATGLEVPRDDNDDPVEPFKAAVDRLWIAEGEDGAAVKFGEFGATQLDNYTKAIESRIQSLAARTRTPPHYLLGEIVNASGDALKAAETGLASKAKGKATSFGEGLEEAIRLAFAWKDDERAGDTAAQVSWAPMESRSESEYVDSLVKKMALGVPKEQLWQDAGYSPQEIARFKTMLVEEAAMRDVFGVNDEEPDGEPTDEPPDPAPSTAS